MDGSAGSFVAVRRLSGSDRAAAFHHSSSGASPRLASDLDSSSFVFLHSGCCCSRLTPRDDAYGYGLCCPYAVAAAEVVTGSTAWIGRGLSCVCAQRRDSDARLSFDLTPVQVRFVYFFTISLPSVLLRILDPANEICNISLFSPPDFILSFRPYSESRIASAPPASKLL
jgi:hypothetical protein